MSSVVQAQGIGRRFGRRWAVARLDLVVGANERLLVIGPNGCGKTTLLRILSTLSVPDQGTLTLFEGESNPRENLALMAHEPGVYEDLSATDNIRVIAQLASKSTTSIPDILESVGLEDRSEPVSTYSAGMRRRLALAVLLLQQPKLALLDEPFAQMDPAGIAQVSTSILELPGAVIIASHQVQHAAPLCTRAILMDEGQIRWQGPASKAEAAWRALHVERGEL